MIRTLLEIAIGLILISIILLDTSTADYVRGYREGQLDAVEDKLDREAWEYYGQYQDELRRNNEIANINRENIKQELEDIIRRRY